jgi:hypothetical protein
MSGAFGRRFSLGLLSTPFAKFDNSVNSVILSRVDGEGTQNASHVARAT